jgi:hypothetical protein
VHSRLSEGIVGGADTTAQLTFASGVAKATTRGKPALAGDATTNAAARVASSEPSRSTDCLALISGPFLYVEQACA